MKNKNYSCTHGCKYSAVAMVNELGFTITFKHDTPIRQLTRSLFNECDSSRKGDSIKKVWKKLDVFFFR